MKLWIKLQVKKVLPESVIKFIGPILRKRPRPQERLRTKRILAAAPEAPVYLDIQALEELQKKYPALPEYGYDPESLEARGKEHATNILNLLGAQEAHSFLELGCWDGMASCILSRKGKKATAIDNRDDGFDKRAASEGVNLLQMDAANLRFEDESFDFVFSYGALEHFDSPEAILREAIRVVKKGGFIYLEFGPLYYSPYGEHAYRSITVPYCHVLFSQEVMNDFTTHKGLAPIDFSHVNGWPLESYEELWSKYSNMLKIVSYKETVDQSHLNLIRKYPSCFKSKSENFENFIVETIKVLFQKQDQRPETTLHTSR